VRHHAQLVGHGDTDRLRADVEAEHAHGRHMLPSGRMSDQSQPPGPKPAPPRLQLQLDDDIAQGVYSNLVLINHTENEFLLDFAFVSPGAPRAKVRARVISTPRHTKRLVRALMKNLERFEERFGEIEAGEDEEPQFH
jgi:hypothetical protein